MNALTGSLIVASAVALWCLVPSLRVLVLPGVPAVHRRAAALSFLRASVRGLAMLPADLVAPLAVPFALLGTKPEDNALPRWARWWGNDVSINGDGWAVLRGGAWVRINHMRDLLPGDGRVYSYDDADYPGDAYYAPGHHPRSFYARWVWLGLRNRASALAIALGHPADYRQPVDLWGDPATGRGHAGWVLRHHNGAYQLHATRRAGALCLRTNYGHKVDFTTWGRPVMPVVCIAISALSWKGQDAPAAAT